MWDVLSTILMVLMLVLTLGAGLTILALFLRPPRDEDDDEGNIWH